jgi:hypothetical protein
VIPKLETASKEMACVLFVLNSDPKNPEGIRLRRTSREALAASVGSFLFKTAETRRGESNYDVEVLLAWDRLHAHPRQADLRHRLEFLAQALSRVLQEDIRFSAPAKG